ncbi:UBC-like protein [Wallemia mellicola]|uniref:UBC-like protein n=1 Tax=Wallemia mellicola TaxID=1708541 RepID=A0AB74KNA2_9BASI|nr:UBC-like protein [Wallemia mellicola]TIC21126.1 UBC-like protein [Wallemia mellicola]TIC38514.1 UBC-like protein [Wallemia mellicola]TIC58094.1 UBC-like protein [Wallemia mellicola]TIC72005.1 UBC-like protein [Wallemia mellicola]
MAVADQKAFYRTVMAESAEGLRRLQDYPVYIIIGASPAARKRLMKENLGMQQQPPPFGFARPDEKDILKWHYVLRGPPDSPYMGGEYHGTLAFPAQYPFKPPEIRMITPSGRFQPNTSICTTFSSFHPASWNPAWSVASILTGLLSFFLDDEIGTGGIRATRSERLLLASKSRTFNRQNKQFVEIFSDLLEADAEPNLDQILDKAAPHPLLPPAPPSQPHLLQTSASKPERSTWERWRWAILLLLAVLISRISHH